MLELAGSERVDYQVNPRQHLPIVLPAIVDVAFDTHGQKLFAGALVARHQNAKPQSPGNRHSHLSEAA